MPVTRIIDPPSAATLLPVWTLPRTYCLAWLEVSIESRGEPGTTAPLLNDLVVQLWVRNKLDEPYEPVAETILPSGRVRAISPQSRDWFGAALPVNLQAGAQAVVVHDANQWWPNDGPTLTVTPYGTWG